MCVVLPYVSTYVLFLPARETTTGMVKLFPPWANVNKGERSLSEIYMHRMVVAAHKGQHMGTIGTVHTAVMH